MAYGLAQKNNNNNNNNLVLSSKVKTRGPSIHLTAEQAVIIVGSEPLSHTSKITKQEP